jgi:hypothetical protein
VNCNKVGFPDQASARERLAGWRKKAKPGEKVPHRVYPCEICDAWHLTTKVSSGKLPPWDRDPNWVRPTQP